MSATLKIEVVYGDPAVQHLLVFNLPDGSTVADALSAATNHPALAGINLSQLKTGVFGHVCKAERLLRDGDRVELYSPLIADPKDARHRRVALGKTMRREG